MSFRPELLKQSKSHIGKENFLDEKSENEALDIFLEILHSGVHGFCISPYEEGQKPGDILSEEQIRRRLSILKKHCNWIRSFSCTEGNELIPKIAKELGMKTLVGAWLGSDDEKNKMEIDNLIELAHQGYVDIAAVGNEVLYRKDLNEQQLMNYLAHVKSKINHVPVGYIDAYYEFENRPAIAEICDIILCNCYPFWEGTPFNQSLSHVKNMYEKASVAGKGKKVIITETGWPSQGQAIQQAKPSLVDSLKYFINIQLWAHDENIEVFYFSSFDESWKTGDEGDVGAHWGIWDMHEQLKFANQYI